MIFVSIIEDDNDIREGLALLINGTNGFSCNGKYPSCESALEGLGENQPDVLLLDIELPGISGVKGIPLIKEVVPDVDILMLTVHEEENLVFDSLCAGACGYLVKTTPPIKLLSAIEEAHNGGAPMSAHIARRVISSFKKAENPNPLTNRESEILSHLVQGQSYKMIAETLCISKGTVHCHIKNIYKKLQVNSNSQAVAKAIRDNLV